MKVKYQTVDGNLFDNEEKALKHETKVLKIKEYFEILVNINFFPNYKIPSGKNPGGFTYTTLGSPSKSDWRYQFMGYTRGYGSMGNGDRRIRFKLRNNTLLILRYYTDEPGVEYLGKIKMDEIILKLNAGKYNL